MRTILLLAERTAGVLDDSAFELADLARVRLGAERVEALLVGAGLEAVAGQLADWCDQVHCFDSAELADPDGAAAARLLQPLVAERAPWALLVPHTNTGMDLAPCLAGRLGWPLVSDCLAVETREDELVAVRAPYGGKLHQRVRVEGSGPVLVSVRPGAHPRPESAPGVGGGVESHAAELGERRRRPLETLAPEPGAVDLASADLLVAVGRGLEEEEDLDVARELAEALGAELACTRPIVDKGWLPKSHQVGTSGVSVKPRAYIAVGLSGSFQHLGGVRGAPFMVAINKDPKAPVFATADVGIVGDLFDIVPALTERVRELKG